MSAVDNPRVPTVLVVDDERHTGHGRGHGAPAAPRSARMRQDAGVPRVRLIGVLSALTVAFDLAVGARALPDPSLRVPDPWSAPIVAGGNVLGDPSVAFGAAGPGAIVWSLHGGGARALELDPASPAGALSSAGPRALALRSVGAATAAGGERLVLAGELAGSTAAIEAEPGAPFGAPVAIGPSAGPLALANYLTGEVALALAQPAGNADRVVLRLQAPLATHLGPPVTLSAVRGTVSAVAVGLDWRGDALVAWQQNGLVYARERRTSGTLGPLQALGDSTAGPRLGALISDDGRGIVAWTDETSLALGTIVRTQLSTSGLNVRFGRATPVQSWIEPAGFRLGAGAMGLIRLANGRVVLGWTARQGGRLVVRVAPVTLAGLHPAVTVSDAGTDAQLADLAAGARGEVLAVFTATEPSAAPEGPGEIEASDGVDEGTGEAVFTPAEPIAPATADSDPTAAFEPVGDHPVIAWRIGPGGKSSQVRYVTRVAEPLP